MTGLIRQHVRRAIIGSAMNDESGDSSEDSDLEDLIVALIILKKNCYLAPRVRLGRAPNITGYLFSLDDAWFKQEFWMLQGSFHQLVSEMQAHPVFQNQSNIPQRPVRDQLMVTLKRMGTYGNGASVGMLARFFRISEETVILYCNTLCGLMLMDVAKLPCCCHNTRLWDNSQLKLKESDLFTPGKYLIADSGFPVETNVVPAYKQPPHAAMP
ncbi:hypothetical protein PSTG_15474 [Puccinia striiformis f. sp. tritici PST-78]|uniref:DDE Tnp4 domain-containing protein n=1 Tax=Puccinia striiformis f. sp. tritici PST-78 TaxID=1165861 RepID=A0A0L0UVK9_9BASI|nr:hypothetical protein PSTG_15474 [Puccinia striiformis f. sp. tritici PST-78]